MSIEQYMFEPKLPNLDQAKVFHDKLERGDGWEICKYYCDVNATFQSQASVCQPPVAAEPDLGGSLENFAEWMKMSATQLMPDCYFTDRISTYDEDSKTAIISLVFHGKHTKTPEGAPLPPPTNKSIACDCVYKIHFNNMGKIDHVVKIWNFEWAAKELGWLKLTYT